MHVSFESHPQLPYIAVALGILAVVTVVIWIVTANNERHQTENRERNRREATRILENGGVQILEEWLFLFPACCPKCKSRVFALWAESFDPGGDGDPAGSRQWHAESGRVCRDCGEVPTPYLLERAYLTVDIERFDSPYLTKEESLLFPDRPPESVFRSILQNSPDK
jgi:hypothetical protein